MLNAIIKRVITGICVNDFPEHPDDDAVRLRCFTTRLKTSHPSFAPIIGASSTILQPIGLIKRNDIRIL